MHIIRTLTNSIEQIFTVVAFYFYIDQKNKFTLNTVILTALISIAFMMRNTSPVGWIPLLAIKVLREGSLLPFLLSGIFVALPILFFCVWVDTTMYNSDKWVFTGYNFLEMNIIHGLSKTLEKMISGGICALSSHSIWLQLLRLHILLWVTHTIKSSGIKKRHLICATTLGSTSFSLALLLIRRQDSFCLYGRL